MTLPQFAERARAQFAARFGHPPDFVAAAPGRVNIIGEHTDYNDGFVLPMAIERWTVLAASTISAPRATFQSEETNSTAAVDLTQPLKRGTPEWANYSRGVLAGFQKRGRPIPGFNAFIMSTVPLGSGLSSSAALEVATATLLEAITGEKLDPIEKALLCQKAEHEFAGVPCGIMDQFTSTLAREGHLLLLDCRSHAVEPVPMTDPTVSVLIFNTNVRHSLASGEYGRRRAECETAAKILGVAALRDATLDQLQAAQDRLEPVVFRRARHVITEIERTITAARAIAQSEWPRVGELMSASHASLRDDYEVSCDELDAVVEIAQGIGPAGGVIGCRMTGGGFGGCAVSLVQTTKVETISKRMQEEYRKRTGIEPAVFVSRPAGGATIL